VIEALVVGQLYSNEEIFSSLKVSNAGGIRVSVQDGVVVRAVIMTSVQGVHGAGENPYHDRLEAGVLTYTAAGKLGEQTLSGANNRLIEQKTFNFPIHGFVLVASRRDRSVGPKRWKYLGLLEYVRHYPDTQLDADGKVRKVWLFEFRIHDPEIVPLAVEAAISSQMLVASRLRATTNPDDDEILDENSLQQTENVERIEHVRSTLLALEPQDFERFVKDLLVHCGFSDVCVTKFSADGGVDVNARAGIGFGSSKTHWSRYRRSAGFTRSDARKSPNCVGVSSRSPKVSLSRPATSRRRLSTRPTRQARTQLLW
jgi:hypothetical protein